MDKADLLPTTRALGAVVRRRRQELGLSQSKLAQEAGVDPKHLQTIEAGIRTVDGANNPTLLSLMKLSEVFGIEVSTLLLETEAERRSRP